MTDFMLTLVPVSLGGAAGILVWYLFIRPWQDRNYERKRRAFGFPPRKILPEDGAFVVCRGCGVALPARDIITHECDPQAMARVYIDNLRAEAREKMRSHDA